MFSGTRCIGRCGSSRCGSRQYRGKVFAAAVEEGTAAKPTTSIPPGSMPCGNIKHVQLSRLFIGGNLIGGWPHSRDLMYASKLFTSYNTEAKVFETLELLRLRHQHDPVGSEVLACGAEIQREP